jgi:integrase
MPKLAANLTVKSVNAAKCPKGKVCVDITDGHTRGLLLRVSSAQVKTWYFRFQPPGKITYTKMPMALVGQADVDASLAWARTEAQRLATLVRDGQDPSKEKEQLAAVAAALKASQNPELPQNWTMAKLLHHYYEEKLLAKGSMPGATGAAINLDPNDPAILALQAMGCQVNTAPRKGKTAGLVARRDAWGTKVRLETNLIKIVGKVLVRDFQVAHWIAVLQPIYARGCHVQANRVLSNTKVMLNWAVQRGCRKDNPLSVLAKPYQEVAKDRSLSFDEIRHLWNALPVVMADNTTLVRLIKLYLLLGKRNSELCLAEKSEIDVEKRLWTIPKIRIKGQNHSAQDEIVPLNDMAWALVEECLANDHPTLMFPNPNGKISYNHSTAGHDLKAYLNPTDELPLGLLGMKPFTIHDLRRTVGTGLLHEDDTLPVEVLNRSKLGITKEDKYLVLNHVSEMKGNVSDQVYDGNKYTGRKRAVLLKWEQFLAELVNPAPKLRLVA